MQAYNPFVIVTGIPEDRGGTLVIASAEVVEDPNGVVTVKGNVLLRMPDVDSATSLVKVAQDAIARRKQ